MNIVQPPLKIVKYPHPALRYPARPLTAINDRVRYLAHAMLDLMYNAHGLGLAAPQVGMPYQLLVMNYVGDPEQRDQEVVLINPVILDKQGSEEAEEGCLSFPELYQKIRRARSIKAQGYTLEGKLLEVGLTDLPSRIWQHEVDHLHGILFIDKMSTVGKLSARGYLNRFEADYSKAQKNQLLETDNLLRARLEELASLA